MAKTNCKKPSKRSKRSNAKICRKSSDARIDRSARESKKKKKKKANARERSRIQNPDRGVSRMAPILTSPHTHLILTFLTSPPHLSSSQNINFSNALSTARAVFIRRLLSASLPPASAFVFLGSSGIFPMTGYLFSFILSPSGTTF